MQKIDLNDKAPGAINHDFQDQAKQATCSPRTFFLHYFATLAGDLLNKLDSLSHSEKELRWGEGGKEPLHIITLKKSIILLSPRSSQQFGGGVTDFSAITPVPASQSISKRQEVWVRGRWMDHGDRRRSRSQTPSPTSPTPAHASRFKVHRLHHSLTLAIFRFRFSPVLEGVMHGHKKSSFPLSIKNSPRLSPQRPIWGIKWKKRIDGGLKRSLLFQTYVL